MKTSIHKINQSNKKDSKAFVTCVLLYARPQNRAKFRGPKCLFDYKNSTILQEQIKEIKSAFQYSEILVCTGIESHKIYKEKNDDFRIIDNPFYEETGTVEDIKLAMYNTYKSNIIFLSDEYVTEKKDLIDMSKSSRIHYTNKNISDVKIINDGEIVKKVGFTGKYFFCGSFSLCDRERDLGNQFLIKDYNKNKLCFEMVNYIIENGGQFRTLEKC